MLGGVMKPQRRVKKSSRVVGELLVSYEIAVSLPSHSLLCDLHRELLVPIAAVVFGAEHDVMINTSNLCS
jgi:hypothetical protein